MIDSIKVPEFRFETNSIDMKVRANAGVVVPVIMVMEQVVAKCFVIEFVEVLLVYLLKVNFDFRPILFDFWEQVREFTFMVDFPIVYFRWLTILQIFHPFLLLDSKVVCLL